MIYREPAENMPEICFTIFNRIAILDIEIQKIRAGSKKIYSIDDWRSRSAQELFRLLYQHEITPWERIPKREALVAFVSSWSNDNYQLPDMYSMDKSQLIELLSL